MTSKELLVNNALDTAEQVREQMRFHLEAGRPALADKFSVELTKAMNFLSFVEGLSEKDADTVKRLLA